MNNADYLKRYLSKDEKKIKKKKKVKHPKSQIIDDDIDISKLVPTVQVDDDDDDEISALRDCLIDEDKTSLNFTRNNWVNYGDNDDVKMDATEMDGQNFPSVAVKQELSDEDMFIKQEPLSPQFQSQDDDRSPMSRKRTEAPSNGSKKKQRHDSDSDASPPRKSTNSKKESRRHDSDSDASPPRKSAYEKKEQRRHDSDSDASPPRKSTMKKKESRRRDSDSSPPRKSAPRESDVSPPRRPRQRDDDLSPPRKPLNGKKSRKDLDQDLSPPRRDKKSSKVTIKEESISVKREPISRAGSDNDESPPRKRSRQDSISSNEGDKLNEKKARNDGGPKVIFRDKYGRRKEAEKEKKEKDELNEAVKAKYDVWNKGIKQKEMRQEMAEEFDKEVSKPLARYATDEDLNDHLKNVEKEGDPMLAYMRKKRAKEAGGSGKALPTYSGPEPAPNRFGIKPGYRWDGVDRSNGFENKFFNNLNERKAMKEIAYKWSSEDM